MEFFDCNAFFGLPMQRPLLPVATADDLLKEMDKAGIGKSLVWHISQHDYSPIAGNSILAESISHHERLLGCWTLVPNQARELPEPGELFKEMKRSGIYALRTFPRSHKFLLNSVSMGDILEAMVERKVPLLLSLIRGMDWQEIYYILSEFPDLVCVICDHGCWGMDRLFRPLIERYANVYIDTAQYLLDGGIESFVEDYGHERILFGSGFPERYYGGLMLQIAHSDISNDACEAIAGGNLERIISEVEL
jgi:predicted TIM-barrel fold metal-dependent hydrolase